MGSSEIRGFFARVCVRERLESRENQNGKMLTCVVGQSLGECESFPESRRAPAEERKVASLMGISFDDAEISFESFSLLRAEFLLLCVGLAVVARVDATIVRSENNRAKFSRG